MRASGARLARCVGARSGRRSFRLPPSSNRVTVRSPGLPMGPQNTPTTALQKAKPRNAYAAQQPHSSQILRRIDSIAGSVWCSNMWSPVLPVKTSVRLATKGLPRAFLVAAQYRQLSRTNTTKSKRAVTVQRAISTCLCLPTRCRNIANQVVPIVSGCEALGRTRVWRPENGSRQERRQDGSPTQRESALQRRARIPASGRLTHATA